MMYRVISYFTDLQDNDHPYNVGDAFPRKGVSVVKERLEELAGPNNKQNRPLIEEIKEDTAAGEETPHKRVSSRTRAKKIKEN